MNKQTIETRILSQLVFSLLLLSHMHSYHTLMDERYGNGNYFARFERGLNSPPHQLVPRRWAWKAVVGLHKPLPQADEFLPGKFELLGQLPFKAFFADSWLR